MITVLSMSPAIDKRIELDNLHPGETNRALSCHTVGAGKGINVSLAAKALGMSVRCIGLLADKGAAITDLLQRNNVPYHFLPAPGTVRTNLKLYDRARDRTTEINEFSPPASPSLLQAALDMAVAAARESDYLVLTGSLPADCPSAFYRDVIHRVHAEASHCRCVLDADGERLFEGLSAHPWLVKPNLSELTQLAAAPLPTENDILSAAKSLLMPRANMAVVSLGGQGALTLAADQVHFAKALPVVTRTTTGAGDAMVAGLLHGLSQALALPAVLRSGIAAATAHCVHDGDAFLHYEDYLRFL